jgi:hypothetical protein
MPKAQMTGAENSSLALLLGFFHANWICYWNSQR